MFDIPKKREIGVVQWGVNMRRDERTGKLREDRITALDKVGFVWVKKRYTKNNIIYIYLNF